MKTKNLLTGLLLATTLAIQAQTAPEVNIVSPTNGMTYYAPANVYLKAVASDTNGIASTQIFVNDSSVVSATTNSLITVLTNPPTGTYVIRGEAMNNLGIRGTSAPVTISVVSLPYVSISTTDPYTSEAGADTALIKVYRTGAVTNDLTVFYSVSGSASNGVDYVNLPGSITIPTGYVGTNVVIEAMDDIKVETQESISLTLKTNSLYRLLSPTSANAYIVDNETNHPPSIQLVLPLDGQSFSDPTNITLVAEASDEDGNAPTVSFFRDGILLGAGIKNPSNDVYKLTWTNIPSGSFVLTARARDGINEGINSTSAPANITITRTNENPYVWITSPPSGWTYTNISILTVSAIAIPGAEDRVVKQADFYLDGALFRTITNSTSIGSYSFIWSNPPPGTHTFTVRATDNANGSTDSAPAPFSITSSAPYVTLSPPDSVAAEPGTNTAYFTLSRTGSTANPFTVNYKITGTASNGVDYVLLPGSVTFPSGQANINVNVTPIDDSLAENTETVTMTLVVTNNSFLVVPGMSNATISIEDNDINQPPTVSLFNPTNNATFNLPTNILLQAEAHDPDGTVSSVKFYRGTVLIGSAYASNTLSSSIFSLLWTNPVAGDYSITARAFDNYQNAATSAPVHVLIQSAPVSNAVPYVTIYYPTNGSKFTAPTNILITANAWETNGVIAAVELFANGISLGMATNNPVEAQLTTLYRLMWTNPVPGNYELKAKVTDLNGATNLSPAVNVTIVSPEPTNRPPTISIVSPTNGSVFYGPTNISINVQASDSDGQISRVYFFSGTQVLGGSTNPPFSFVWTNVQPGTYSVTAKAYDNQNAFSSSAPVYFTVKSITEFSFVSRSLPLWYIPGVQTLVKLQATPKSNTLYYVVHDSLPAGWTITGVGENGSIDTGGLGVTFGPFNDGVPRSFNYMVRPPANESGEKRFSGTGTANGVTSPIVGVAVMTPAQPHPADINPTNFFIGTDELDAYTTAWKRCQSWPISPSPIPVNYLTRAGYLAQGGGSYQISTTSPPALPPLTWVRNASVADITSNTISGGVPWTTNYGTAIASMPTNYFSNVTFTVNIAVTPATTCSAYAIEDRPPERWVVTNVNNGGFYCPILKKVKWGLFMDNQPRTLTYQVTPNTNLLKAAYFSGVASFDGINVPITGKRSTFLSTGIISPATLQSIITSPNGDRIITFRGEAGVVYQLEASENLTTWEPLQQMLNNDGVLYYTDPATTNFVNRFYRAIPMSGN